MNKPKTMSQQPKLCMFCGLDQSHGPMNREHFVPKGLWGGARPTKTKTVWAHKKCNSAFSDDNEYFRDVLAIDAFNRHPEAEKLVDGAIHRKLKKHPKSLLKSLRGIGIRPVYSESGLFLGNLPSFTVDWDRIQRVLANVTKGIYLTSKRIPIPSDFKIHIRFADDRFFFAWKAYLDCLGDWKTFGDDVFATRWSFFQDDPRAMACVMQFYNRFQFFSLTVPPEVDAAALRNLSEAVGT